MEFNRKIWLMEHHLLLIMNQIVAEMYHHTSRSNPVFRNPIQSDSFSTRHGFQSGILQIDVQTRVEKCAHPALYFTGFSAPELLSTSSEQKHNKTTTGKSRKKNGARNFQVSRQRWTQLWSRRICDTPGGLVDDWSREVVASSMLGTERVINGVWKLLFISGEDTWIL